MGEGYQFNSVWFYWRGLEILCAGPVYWFDECIGLWSGFHEFKGQGGPNNTFIHQTLLVFQEVTKNCLYACSAVKRFPPKVTLLQVSKVPVQWLVLF
jgi:hypothetical protein